MKKIVLSAIFAVISIVSAWAVNTAQIDTLEVLSPSMNANIATIVIKPADFNKSKKYPVVYMLNGHGGHQFSWLEIQPELPRLASEHQVIMVCPAGHNSWYWDSPVDPSKKFETFVSGELVDYIDSHYPTISSPAGRAITGLSMGGHGAMFLGISHQDVFGACGSMSGGLDIRPFPKNWNMNELLGEYADNPSLWEEHTVINLVDRIRPGFAITFDCGTDDFFFRVNNRLHEELLYRNIPHDFSTRPGGHTWDYWNNSLDYHLLFFDKFFKKAESKK